MNRTDRRSVLGAVGAAVTFSLAGCSSDGADEEGAGLRIGNLGFAQAKPSYRDYRPQSNSTYFRGDTAHIYFEIVGHETQEGDSFSEQFDLTEQLTVTDPNGETMIDRTINLNENAPGNANLERFYFTNTFSIPDDAPTGDYTLDMEVRDELDDETAAESATFSVA